MGYTKTETTLELVALAEMPQTLIMSRIRTVTVLGFYLPFDGETLLMVARYLEVRDIEKLARCVCRDPFLRSNLGSYVFRSQLALRTGLSEMTRFTQQRMKLLIDIAAGLKNEDRRAYMFAFVDEMRVSAYPEKTIAEFVGVFRNNLQGRFMWVLFPVTGERGSKVVIPSVVSLFWTRRSRRWRDDRVISIAGLFDWS